MKFTAASALLSNSTPEKCGFEKIKKGRIHSPRFTLLGCDIIQISKKDFDRILVKSSWHFVAALPS
jgi:hypothetical protein